MGGCCSSRKLQLHGTSVYYYCPPPSEEHDTLPSQNGVATVLSSRLLIDLNLNMAVPETYQPPPAPEPYNVVSGRPHTISVVMSEQRTATNSILRKPSFLEQKEALCRVQPSSPPLSPRKVDLETLKSDTLTDSAADEEDCCPTCLEEYDMGNPKIATKCNHHFHLACILEWMERSDTCPICDKEMIYETHSKL